MIGLNRNEVIGLVRNSQASGCSYSFVCFERDEDEEGEVELVVAIVTASQDEADARLESDDPVYSVPMPEKICEVGGALRRRELRAGGRKKRKQ